MRTDVARNLASVALAVFTAGASAVDRADIAGSTSPVWVAAAPRSFASPAGADGVLYSFEAPDYQLGELDGQQGWTTDSDGSYAIVTSNPYAGAQELHTVVEFDGFGAAAFGPTIMNVGTQAFSVATAEIAIHNQGAGQGTEFSPSSAVSSGYTETPPVTRVLINSDGSIEALQPGPAFAPTTGAITDTAYHEFKVVADNSGAGTIEICLDGSSIFTGANMSFTAGTPAYIDTIWLLSTMDIGSIGSTNDFDDVSITDAPTGGCSSGNPGAWNFDGVIAPALPTAWTTDTVGAGVGWLTESTIADSAPNAAYTPDISGSSESSLYSVSASVDPAGAQLTFRHRWNASETLHGGVLEISIAGAPFVDIVDAGGSFVEGGYNETIGGGNPLGARPAWTGDQETFVTTTVLLPPAAAGQSVQFRWRFGSDASVAATAPNGWWVDTVVLTALQAPTIPVAAIAPDALSFVLVSGAMGSDAMSIANTGGGTLNFNIPFATDASRRQVDYAAPFTASLGTETFNSSHGLVTGLRGRAALLGAGAGVDIAQMSDNAPVAGNGFACGSPGINTAATSWWRRFYFNEYPMIGAATTINSVTVASETGPDLPVTINLYTISHDVPVDDITLEQLTLIGTGAGAVGGDLTLTDVPLSANVVDTVGSDLVVEYHIDGTDEGSFYPGGNPSPQTHATLVSSATCGQTEPVNAASLGNPDFHVVMVVNASESMLPDTCSAATDASWLTLSPPNGSLSRGASMDVAVAVDSSGLAAGDYSATICVATNDATQPVVQVPVSLSVTVTDAIFGDGFDGN